LTCANNLADEQGNPTIQQLTPQLKGVFEKVLSPPEDQLEPQTRTMVQQMAGSS
jgi:ABC-type cobalt transport system substrate-binding protein